MGYASTTQNAIRFGILLLVTSAASQAALEATPPVRAARTQVDIAIFSATPGPADHLESILSVFQVILSANYPSSTPRNFDPKTLTWPSALPIAGAIHTIHPSNPQTQKTPTPTYSDPEKTPIPTYSAKKISDPSASTSNSSGNNVYPHPNSMPSSVAGEPRSRPVRDANRNGDRGIAIGVGLLLGLIAVGIAVCIFWLLWRRKRQTGKYFKPARCSVCTVTTEEGGARNLTPCNGAPDEHDRLGWNWLVTSSNDLGPRVNGSTGNMPNAVEQGHARHPTMRTYQAHPIYGPGPTRLTKSNSTLRGGTSEPFNLQGAVNPHELAGDDQDTITEMDACSPTRVISRQGRARPSVEPVETPQLSPEIAELATAQEAAFVSQDNPRVIIQTASASGSESGDMPSDEDDGNVADSDCSPNWTSFPLQRTAVVSPVVSHMPSKSLQDRFSPLSSEASSAARDRRDSPLPFSPVWRQGICRPRRSSSFTGRTGQSPSPFTDDEMSPVRSLRGRRDDGQLGQPDQVHYPSHSEMNEFDFDGLVIRRYPNWDGSDDGWRPVPDRARGRYELAS